jgi:hypothetical protein
MPDQSTPRPPGLDALLGHVAARLPDPADATHEMRLAVLDGRDALAFVLIRPATDDPDRITVEANARGISKAAAAYALRKTADSFDTAAAAEGDEPIPYPPADAEQQQTAEATAAVLAEPPAGTPLTAEELARAEAHAAAPEHTPTPPTADTLTVTVADVEAALRGWLACFEYDLHKATERPEDGSKDQYPAEAADFFDAGGGAA